MTKKNEIRLIWMPSIVYFITTMSINTSPWFMVRTENGLIKLNTKMGDFLNPFLILVEQTQ